MAERSSSSRRTKPSSDGAIGHFVIDKEIGKGSFAQVYSGRHKVSLLLLAVIIALEVGRGLLAPEAIANLNLFLDVPPR